MLLMCFPEIWTKTRNFGTELRYKYFFYSIIIRIPRHSCYKSMYYALRSDYKETQVKYKF